MKENFVVYRGEVYYADLSPVIGSEQGGIRPVLIVQNDVGNKHSPTTIIAPITSRFTKKPLPTHVPLSNCGLAKDSIALCEQLRTIDKRRLKEKLGSMDEKDKVALDRAIEISLGLA
jgi:mRNA interferase MazF